jgi:ketosteroid isomerase-like protein
MFRAATLPTVAVMEHPNATFARNLYTALAAGDVATVFDALADDLVMINDIGAGPWRELYGKQAVLEFWGRWMDLFDGTFRTSWTSSATTTAS